MIKKVYAHKGIAVCSIVFIVIYMMIEVAAICALINRLTNNDDIFLESLAVIVFSFFLWLSFFGGNRMGNTVTYNRKEKTLYRKGLFFGYKYQLKVEDIEDVVIGTFYRDGTYYILVDPYNNRYDGCYKKSFIRLEANDKNREFIELFWHRPITKNLPQDTVFRNK